MSSVIFQVQSFLIVALLLYGVYNRKIRYKHVKIMKTAIIWDLLLVAQIELNRQAINTASKVTTNPMILNIHVSLAVSTVLLYLFVYISGKKILDGDESWRRFHKPIAIVTLTTRILTLITSNLIEVNQ